MGYTKLFDELVKSSIWDADDKTRIVWITMLALKDKDHFVRGTVQFLSGAARVKVDECVNALAILAGPDPNSRTIREDGRRIREVPGGWEIVNGEVYANKLNKIAIREYKAERQRIYRQKWSKKRHPVMTRRTPGEIMEERHLSNYETNTTPCPVEDLRALPNGEELKEGLK